MYGSLKEQYCSVLEPDSDKGGVVTPKGGGGGGVTVFTNTSIVRPTMEPFEAPPPRFVVIF